MKNVKAQDTSLQIEAAQKTIAILKLKVIDLYNGGSQTAIQKQLESSKRRDEENRRKRELMAVRNQELKNYTETLEGEVTARTTLIKTILNNVQFGFFVINSNFEIQSEYSKTCEDLFGTDSFAGGTLLDILQLQGRAREHFQLGLDQVFEDIMPTEVSLSQLPNRFEFNGRVLKTEGKALRKDGAVVGILYTVSDISQLEQAQNEALENRVLINVLRQKDAFRDFVSECRDLIEHSYRLVKANDQITLRRIVHTLKGNSATWGLKELAHAIHEMEESDAISSIHLEQIKNLLIKFLDNHKAVVGVSYSSGIQESYEVNFQHMASLQDMVAEMADHDAEPFRQWATQVLQKPASSLLGPLDEFVNRLAERLDKKVKFQVRGESTLVDVGVMRGPFQNLIHLLRNAIDHGIETAELRGDKSAVGLIEMNIHRDNKFFYIEVSDDGRGIDTDKLVEKVLSKGLMSQVKIASLSHKEKLDLVFLDSISSAESVTEISGRGVGMSAMLESVKKVQGSIRIESQANRGTQFIIEIPVPEVQKIVRGRVA